MKLDPKRLVALGLLAWALGGAPNQIRADIVTQITPATLSSNTQIDTGGFGSGAINTLIPLPGVTFGKMFAGQVLGADAEFDTLSGTPSGPLSLVTGSAGRNLFSIVNLLLAGVGPTGVMGTGAFSVLFDQDQSQFGFDLTGGDGGDLTIQFFRRDGSLINTLTVLATPTTTYAFKNDDGIADIAGISITNNDTGGVAFSNFQITITSAPEPATFVSGLVGVLIIGISRRRIRNGGRPCGPEAVRTVR